MTIGQNGYIGRRFAFQFGVGTNFSLIKHTNRFENYFTEKGILIPKLTVGIFKENSKGNSIILELTYNQLPNSLITAEKIEEKGFFGTYYIYSKHDSLFTKSDNIKLTYGFRRYKELGPLGRYFDFRFCTNLTFNTSLFKSEVKESYIDYNIYNSTITKIVTSSEIFSPQLTFGFGKVIPLNKRMALDFGARGSLFIGRTSGFSSFDDPILYHRIISLKKLISTNLFELYVNILLFN